MNEQVRESMAQAGDDGSAVREVVHFTYPLDRSGGETRDVVMAELMAAGFAVARIGDGGIAFRHQTELASARFDRLTETLLVDLGALGWGYDGWEALTVSSRS